MALGNWNTTDLQSKDISVLHIAWHLPSSNKLQKLHTSLAIKYMNDFPEPLHRNSNMFTVQYTWQQHTISHASIHPFGHPSVILSFQQKNQLICSKEARSTKGQRMIINVYLVATPQSSHHSSWEGCEVHISRIFFQSLVMTEVTQRGKFLNFLTQRLAVRV